MTTIAYRDGIVAADTLATRGNMMLPSKTSKLRRMTDGGVAAMTGSFAEACRLVKWIDDGENGEQPDGDCTVMVIDAHGRISVYEGGGSFLEEAEFMALGSGAMAALTAMHMGAGAKKAVEMAALVDTETGGVIETMEVAHVRPVSVARQMIANGGFNGW